MKITLDGVEHDFAFKSITNKEAIAIEAAVGCTFGEWCEQVDNGSFTALTALIWTFRKRTEPTLRFNDVEFTLGGVHVDVEDEEVAPLPEGATSSDESTSEPSPAPTESDPGSGTA